MWEKWKLVVFVCFLAEGICWVISDSHTLINSSSNGMAMPKNHRSCEMTLYGFHVQF